jgi:tyrosine-specific transport protein
MHIIHTFGHLLGGTLLVAGTSIGVGMLALPVATSPGGFFPALAVYVACWLFMLCTGLLVLEACIWMPKESNFITLTSRLLGKWGKTICWILYLFLFSCLMIAHVTGGGDVVSQLSQGTLPFWSSALLYVLFFAPAVYWGALWVDRFNLILMLGVLFTYLFFVGSSITHIEPSYLMRMDWGKIGAALPIVFTAFGYQSLIPTLYNYMNRNIAKVRLAIMLGTSIPFLIYVIWEMIILGIVPFEGPGGLQESLTAGAAAINPLGSFLNNFTLLTFGQAFAFFAMTTSFLGISIAFVDFLADGLKIRKKGRNKLGLCFFVFGLPLLITWINPHLFIKALTIAGGFGVALLLGAIPIMMVWAGRYVDGHSLLHQQLPGGKVTLSVLTAFVFLELIFNF